MTSKIHAVVDSNGLPVQLPLNPGEAHELRLAGYDADCRRELAMKKSSWANIPPKSNHSDPICFSRYLYRARDQVERFFNRIKQCRCVVTRYDSLRETTLRSSNSDLSGYGWPRRYESTP